MDHGLLQVVQPEGEEYDVIIRISVESSELGKSLGNGEIETGAVAIYRNWAMAIDDRAARDYYTKRFPKVQLLTTPEIVKHWAELTSPPASLLREALICIRRDGKYAIGRAHPAYKWWQNCLKRDLLSA